MFQIRPATLVLASALLNACGPSAGVSNFPRVPRSAAATTNRERKASAHALAFLFVCSVVETSTR